MNKKFLQSVAAGIATLSLVASCSHLGLKKESNTCGAKNGCAAKKDEAHKCSAKHKEAHKCSAVKKEEAAKEATTAKKAKKAKKAEAAKAETKAEEKKN
jgi:hypothetical protein